MKNKKILGWLFKYGFLKILLAELAKAANGTHYRAFKINGGQELHKHRTAFKQLLEMHNIDFNDRGEIVLNDNANNKRFCDFSLKNLYWKDRVFG